MRRRQPQQLLALVVLLAAAAARCCHAAPPADLTNFQNEHGCPPNRTLIVRPRTLDDVVAAVLLHDHVMATGEGHSWQQPFFCVAPGVNMDAASAAAAAAAPAAAAAAPAEARPLAAGRRLAQAAANASAPANATFAGADSLRRPSSANIVMTTLRPLTIAVDEASQTVWADAGVLTIELLQYLSHYVTPAAPSGYTLPAFPWFVYQTIGGAVATNTHGSSLQHGSLSNQVTALDVILANGTRRMFTNATDPFLMRALRVSVGRLGVIARVQLRIVHDVPVKRTLRTLTPPQFLQLLEGASASWAANGTLPSWANESEFFWITQKQIFMMVSFERSDDPAATAAPGGIASLLRDLQPDNTTVFTKKGDVLRLGELVLPSDANITVIGSQVLLAPPDGQPAGAAAAAADAEPYARARRWLAGFMAGEVNAPVPEAAADGPAAATVGSRWTLPPHKPPSVFYGAQNMAEGLMELMRLGVAQVAGNQSAEATASYIKQPESTLQQLVSTPYDQYEVAIPVATMAACMAKVLDTVYGGDLMGEDKAKRAADKGFRTAPLIRFVGAEDGLLSLTHDGPRMFINLEDYLFYNQGRKVNAKFKAVMAVLMGDPACTSKGPVRRHWGKAGWPDVGCFYGDEVFGANWCSFGCALRALDPGAKFSDASSEVWSWRGVDLDRCCGAGGFDAAVPGCECKVAHVRAAADCPPAPHYTTR